MSEDFELVYIRLVDGGFMCGREGCTFKVSESDIRLGEASLNVLQDHAHAHRARSVRVDNGTPPVEVDIVEV